ncbi:hypothetical protein L6164_036187 [Bauhinia variegata]|uniref:Uncharacterized protein n=1 Tax=Bauhinia variegata TaxID=167791 RepID=A0ACB9KGA6_BAUVA|nr:hypothetical protein L6164_036187 [Bauhinia variegata]
MDGISNNESSLTFTEIQSTGAVDVDDQYSEVTNYHVAESNTSKKGRRETEDRLNILPKRVILLILSFLDTKMAVLTCFFVLSKQWRYLWRELPTLRFDSASFKQYSSFKRFVLGLLSGRDTSKDLCKFSLTNSKNDICYGNGNDDDDFLLQLFVNLVAYGKGLRNLTFCARVDSSTLWSVYPVLFTWKSLTTLRLDHVVFPKNMTFDCPSLKGLFLVGCTLERDDREDHHHYDLFRGCPELETLWIYNCQFWRDVKSFVISAPKLENFTVVHVYDGHSFDRDFNLTITSANLKSFTYEGRTFYDISFTCPDSIEDLSVGVGTERFTYGMRDLMNMFKIFQQLSKAKVVTLTHDIINVSYPRVPGFPRLPSPFTELRFLKIRTTTGPPPHIEDYLISRSPNAEVTMIHDEVKQIDP